MKRGRFTKIVLGMTLFLFSAVCFSYEAYAITCEACGSGNVSEFSNIIPCCDSGIEYTCNDCWHTWGVSVPAVHNYSSVTTPATTTSEGLIEYTCANCGDYYSETIPMLAPNPDPTGGAGSSTGVSSDPTGGASSSTGVSSDPTGGAGGSTGGGSDPTGGAGGSTGGGSDPTGGAGGSSGGSADPAGGTGSSTGGDALDGGASAEPKDANGDGAGSGSSASTDSSEVSPDEDEPDAGLLVPSKGGLFSKQVELEGAGSTVSVSEFISDMGVALTGLWHDSSQKTKMIVGAALVAAVGGGATYVTISASKVAKAAKIANEVKAARGIGEVLELNSKKVLVCLDKEKAEKDFISHIKKRPYLTVVKADLKDAETLINDINEHEPELLILSSACLYCLDEIKESAEDLIITVLAGKESFAEKVKELKKDKKIDGYCLDKKYSEKMLVDLVLPIYKSEINVENGLEAVGSIADALGIPFVSTVTTLINEGKNVRDTIKDKDFSVSGVNGIVSSIAEVMGFDGIGNITTMIDNAGTVKEKKESLKTTEVAEDNELSPDGR